MDDLQAFTPVISQTLAQLNDSSASMDKIMADNSENLDLYRAADVQKGKIEDRISTLGNLQLARDTTAMQALIPDIKQAKADLDKVIGKISKASELVDGVTKFLGVVDTLANIAKSVV
jgi:hypothetical protein